MIDQTAEALIYLANRAAEQGSEILARSLYEEGLAIWRVLDDAPCIAYALERLRTLEGNAPSTKWAGRSSDTGTPATTPGTYSGSRREMVAALTAPRRGLHGGAVECL
jgi:hypothetical protein